MKERKKGPDNFQSSLALLAVTCYLCKNVQLDVQWENTHGFPGTAANTVHAELSRYYTRASFRSKGDGVVQWYAPPKEMKDFITTLTGRSFMYGQLRVFNYIIHKCLHIDKYLSENVNQKRFRVKKEKE